ncbi:MAG: hypothetical protein WCW33_04935 [Candidatus Babeliales bacterium]|jgi:hypothetical protein
MRKLPYATIAIFCLIVAPAIATNNDVEQLTRKKNASLAIILQGLAQSCSQVSDILTANDPQIKQQGVLNVIGTVLVTVAQLTEPHTTKAPELDHASATLATLSTVLFEEIDQEQRADIAKTSPLLTQLMVLQPQEREAFTRTLIASPIRKSKFFDELFDFLASYLVKNIPHITECIKKHLIYRLDPSLQE